MKKYFTLLCLMIMLFLAGTETKAQLLQWNTFGNLGTETTEPSVFNDANIAATNLTQGTITPAANGNRFGGSGWFDAGNTVGGNTLAEAVTGNDYIQFIVTPNAGFSFTPTSFVFNWDRSASGPSSVTLRSSADGFTANLGTITGIVASAFASNTITITGLTGITTPTTFRLYGYAASATSGTGGFDIATNVVNVQLNGSTTAVGIPTFNISSSFTTFSTLVGVPTAQQPYTISGLNLTPNQVNGISITAPANFEVSLTSNTFTGINGNTVTLSSNGTGNIVGEPVTVYVRYFPAVSGNTTANIAHIGAGVTPAQNLSVSGVSTAYFYSKPTGDLTLPSTFNSAANGSGSDAVNFTNNNQTFEIRNRTTATITSNWTVSGTGSKIVVGNGVDFTIPPTNFVASTVDVLATGKLILQNSTLPVIAALASGSTVEYAQTAATAILNTTTDIVTYSNLKLSNSGLKSFKNATTTVTGNLTYDGTTNGPLVIDAASASVFTTVNLGGDLTYLGTVTNPVDANGYTLVTTGTGTQTITGNNNIARFFKLTANSSGNNVVLSTLGGTTNAVLGNASGGGLQLNTGTILNLGGNDISFFAGTATSVSGAGTITGSANSSMTINKIGATAFGTLNFTSGARLLKNLTVNVTSTTPTVTLGTTLDIYNTLAVTAGQIVLGANNLTLKSSATATAVFASTTVIAPVSYNSTGKVVVERYISNIGRKWRLLSARSTVSTQTIFDSWQEGGAAVNNLGTWITAPGGANGFDGTSNSSSILKHDQVAPGWVALTATNTGTINDYQGYMLFVRGDRNDNPGNASNAPTVLRTTGQLRVGTQPGVTISATGSGRTLVGNPFASPVDMENIFSTTSNLDQNMYVWDATLTGNYGVGGYRLVERTAPNTYQQTPVAAGGTASSPTSRYIHSGQAFFLKATGVDASVIFNESDKSVLLSPDNPIINAAGEQQIWVNLMIMNPGKNALLADGIRVRFSNLYSAGLSDDIEKISNFTENISSYRGGKKLIVEKRPMIQSTDTIFLNMTSKAIRQYSLQLGTFDFVQTDLSAILEDNYLQTKTKIDLKGVITNYDYSVTADPASASPDRFRIVFGSKKTDVPVVNTEVNNIYIYPNPVSNRMISIQFTDMAKGVYQLRLLSTMGQVIMSQQVNYAGGSSSIKMGLDKQTANGTYRLEIIKPDNSKVIRGVMILN